MKKAYEIKVTENVSGLALIKGFKLAGVGCDIRGKNDFSRLDLTLIASDKPATGAGVFTTNDVKAAPVILDTAHLKASKKIKAIVAHSGVANACTGARGLADAEKTCALVAKKFNVSADEVLVCSTGRIGDFLPMEKISKGIDEAFSKLESSQKASENSARAIMTTDTCPKTVLVEVKGKHNFSVAGMAKGAGMIEPNMATMLAFTASDVKISKPLLKKCLKLAADKTFNRITVDGDMSTNDTVLCLCNGESGVNVTSADAELLEAFENAVIAVCRSLARMIVSDGEKITRVVEINVSGARTQAQAEKICRAIGNSMLVKSAWFGGDPNWGRITDAAGYARTGIDFEKIDLSYDKVPVVCKGTVMVKFTPEWKKVVAQKTFSVNLNLNLGEASETILSTDLTDGYVIFNKGE